MLDEDGRGRRSQPVEQPQQPTQPVQPAQPQQPAQQQPQQPKQNKGQKRLASLYQITGAGKTDKDSSVLRQGQNTLSKVGNIATENDKTANSLNKRAEEVDSIVLDYSQAFKPTTNQTLTQEQNPQQSKGFTQPKTNIEGVDEAVESRVKSASTGTMGGFDYKKDMTADQIQLAAKPIVDNALKSLEVYYSNATSALDAYQQDAKRFLDEEQSGAAQLAQLAQTSVEEEEAKAYAELMSQQNTSNTGALDMASAYGANNAEQKALNSEIYASDVNQLRNESPQQLAQLSAAEAARAQAGNKLTDTISNKSKTLSKWLETEKGNLTDGEKKDRKRVEDLGSGTVKTLQEKEKARQDEVIARVKKQEEIAAKEKAVKEKADKEKSELTKKQAFTAASNVEPKVWGDYMKSITSGTFKRGNDNYRQSAFNELALKSQFIRAALSDPSLLPSERDTLNKALYQVEQVYMPKVDTRVKEPTAEQKAVADTPKPKTLKGWIPVKGGKK